MKKIKVQNFFREIINIFLDYSLRIIDRLILLEYLN